MSSEDGSDNPESGVRVSQPDIDTPESPAPQYLIGTPVANSFVEADELVDADFETRGDDSPPPVDSVRDDGVDVVYADSDVPEPPPQPLRYRLHASHDLYIFFLYFLNFFGGLTFGFGIALATFLYLPLQMYLKTLWPQTSLQSNTNIGETSLETYSHLFTSFVFCFIGIGAFLVNLFFGPLVDRVGRRPGILIVCGLGVVATIGVCASVAYPMLLVFMMGYGLYLGSVSYLIPLYIGENSPTQHERTVGVLFQIGAGSGMVLDNVINIVIEDLPATWNWRLGMGFQFVFCIVWIVVFFLMPESQVWEESSILRKRKLREKRRQKILRFLENGKGSRPPREAKYLRMSPGRGEGGRNGTASASSRHTSHVNLDDVGLALDDDFDPLENEEELKIREEERKRKQQERELLVRENGCKELCCSWQYVRNFWVGIFLTTAMKLTGIDIIGSFAPVLFVEANFTHSNSNFYSLLFSFFSVCTTFLPLLLINRVGRKVLVLFGLALQTGSAIAVGIVFQVMGEGAHVAKAGVGIGCFVLFLFGFNSGIGATYFQAINVMKFPLSVRPHVSAFFVFVFYFLQCAIFATFTPLGELFQSVSYGFYFFGVSGVVSFIALIFLMPLRGEAQDEPPKPEIEEELQDRFDESPAVSPAESPEGGGSDIVMAEESSDQ